jgi:hypothetical protein
MRHKQRHLPCDEMKYVILVCATFMLEKLQPYWRFYSQQVAQAVPYLSISSHLRAPAAY